MNFDEIINESRERKFALVLNGLEMNLLMLAAEIAMESEGLTASRGPLSSVLRHLKTVAGKKRFIELSDLKDLPEITVESIKQVVERRFLDGTPEGVNAGDGSQ